MGGLDRPPGNIVINTKRGPDFNPNEDEFNSYILPDSDMYEADEPRNYVDRDNRPFTVGKYTKDIRKLSQIKF